MNSKYFSEGKINISDLKHDIVGLMGPLSFSRELTSRNETDKALHIQNELLRKLQLIIGELDHQISAEETHQTSGV